ncbi:MAG: hypothetical protein RLZZ600_372 [Actinomycetota bacterium]|jgi:riboflavin biosynthesis pyrimidine reductase
MQIYSFGALSSVELTRLYEWSPSVTSRINVVVDATGSMRGVDGSSQSLTSQHDRKILHVIRAGADAVIVGAQSVRTEGWHIPQNALLAVVTNKGFEALPPCPHPDSVVTGPLVQILEELNSTHHWVAEGGQSVIEQLLALKKIDQLCISFRHTAQHETVQTPELPGWLVAASPSPFTCVFIIRDEDMLFTLWRRGAEA